MGSLRTLILVMFGATAASAGAQVTEIYKCVEADGRKLYTSDRRETSGRKCELVSRQVNVVPAQKTPPPRAAAPGTFPRESAAERATGKGRQREILENELATEQQLLDKARKELAEQEAVRTGEERNYARVLERLQPFKDSVDLHEKNIDALRRELGNLK
jgi:hypothetical protein